MSAIALPDNVDLSTLDEALRLQSRMRVDTYYPLTGPLRRELYPKHMAFFAAGREYTERACIAANRVGKSEGISAYEVTLHVTGKYPDWWQGRRFSKAVSCWASGTTNLKTRDILQAKLLGAVVRDGSSVRIGLGTGMIPAESIIATKAKSGVPDAIDVAYVRHASGGISTITFKSYEQGRKAFEGNEVDVVALDEEPDERVYDECVMRTMATGLFRGGIILLTFTPLEGWTEVIGRYLNEDERKAGNRFVVQISWDEAPHLSESEKTAMLAKLPPHQRDARSKGIPQLGSGAIYPVGESEYTVQPFEIPAHWPRAYGLDVGWNWTAAIWGARDRDTDTIYLYSEYFRGEGEPSIHAAAIRGRGEWIPGVIDPAANGRSQTDGEQLLNMYKRLGLDIKPADHSVETGLYEVWVRMTSGRLKVFASLHKYFEEIRLYRRDDKGRIVKKKDHVMDAKRYLILSGIERMITRPIPRQIVAPRPPSGPRGWMT